jgi:ribosome biogenesis protein ENP2
VCFYNLFSLTFASLLTPHFKFGRDLKYHHPSCDLFVAAACPEIYRLNLSIGRYNQSFATSLTAINTLAINPAHGLLGAGGDNGKIEFWHSSQRNMIASLDVIGWLSSSEGMKALGGIEPESFPSISKVEFHNDGLSMAVGTESGHVLLYDLRKPTPLIVKDHQYGLPIKSMAFHPTGNIMSADSKVARFWNKDTVNIYLC